MHDVIKHLNMNIALPVERLQLGVNITVPWIDGTINCEYCYVHMSCQLYTSIYELLSLQCTASNKL